MRLLFSSLPWELLGPRPAMITLTYPRDWRRWCPNADVLGRHREAFYKRWLRRWGQPVGVWVVEFQVRGAPHLHIYGGLPESVSDEDYEGLRDRTKLRRRLEMDFSKREARRRTPQIGGKYGGAFAEELLAMWFDVVGSGEASHARRGVDVAVAFFSDEAERGADRMAVADYFWKESGKFSQKRPPEAFGGLKFYDYWGEKRGFKPARTEVEVAPAVFFEARRMVLAWERADMITRARKGRYHVRPRAGRPRGRDGVTAFLRDATRGPRLLLLAEKLAAEKASPPVSPELIAARVRRSRRAVEDNPPPEVLYERWRCLACGARLLIRPHAAGRPSSGMGDADAVRWHPWGW